MVRGIDIIGHNKPLQRHWMIRLAAFLVDWVIVSTPFWAFYIAMERLGAPGGVELAIVLYTGAVLIFYSSFLEYKEGQTVGKFLFRLRVRSAAGPLTIEKCVVRNISKIFVGLLFLDWVIGLATEGDPRQRYTDRIAEVFVAHEGGEW